MYDTISKLINTVAHSGKKYDIEKIRKAYDYAEELHSGQFRNSGEPYICHPVAVAEIVADLGLDTDSICASLLHDTVEDCADKTSLEQIELRFGKTVAGIVDGLTKIKVMQIEDKEEAHMENIRKMLLAMTHDYRVIFIKLCDRLHNMRTLSAKSPASQRSISLETMYIYAPLAHRLGMQIIKQELENLSLYYLDRVAYDEIKTMVEEKYGKSSNVIETARKHIIEKLNETGITFEIESRTKSVYSLYRKIYGQNKSFDEIYDFFALRVIVNTELECYTVLGLIHEMFVSVPGRFKDYISTPKPNMYRSLHTTVMSKTGVPFEVQIRTFEMHHVAEFGLAAHWKYKSGEKSKDEIDEKLRWIGQLLEDDTRDPDEFLRSFKTDIFNDETFVFTPRGDVISLPFGSTCIDFAYFIHSAVGNKMVGAKVNGKMVPIDRVLHNGEIVEIITSNASKGPSRDWLKIVRTGEARNKIRQWYKKEKRAENIVVGKKEIEKELKRFAGNRTFTESQQDEITAAVALKFGFQGAEDLYNTIGFGGIAMTRLSKRLQDELDRVVPPSVEPETPAAPEDQFRIAKNAKNIKHGSGIVVDGVSGCEVKFAKCCNPLPGDEIIGFITKGFGISVHKCDCLNIRRAMSVPENTDRWVNVRWERDESGTDDKSLYEAVLQVYVHDEIGALADISAILADMRVSITAISSRKLPDSGMAVISLTIGCKDVSHFQSIVSRLKNIRAVESISRGYNVG